MAYLNPLDPTTPAAGNWLTEGDDRVRELKAAIRERLERIVADIDADPLTFVAGVVSTGALADGAVTAAKLADNSVDTAAIINLAVGDSKIAGLDGAKLTDATVTGPKLADSSVTASKIADGSVGTAELAGLAVTTDKLALDSVTSAQIADDTVNDTDLAVNLRNTLVKHNFADTVINTFNLVTNTSWDSPDIPLGGALVGDIVIVTPRGDQAAAWAAAMRLITYKAFVVSNGNARIRLQNNTGGPVVIPTGTWRVMALRRYTDWYP